METTDIASDLGLEGEAAEEAISADEDAAAEAATVAGAAGAPSDALRAELAMVNDMLSFVEPLAARPDERMKWLVDWIKCNLAPNGHWNHRRLIIFTEWEDTRRCLERRLREALADTDRSDERIDVFTGATSAERREEVKRAFNTDPAKELLRILICTDAAREGVNLQSYYADLIHFDLPWNPARLEQRNGRIDRKLQPAKLITCRYFQYAQREADVVLDALVRKTERIREELGSAGQVIEERVADRLAQAGIEAGRAEELAREIEAEDDVERLARARAEMDDEERVRFERVQREREELAKALETSRERVGVDAIDLHSVVAAALKRAEYDLDKTESGPIGRVHTYLFDPNPTSPTHGDFCDFRQVLSGQAIEVVASVGPERAVVPTKSVARRGTRRESAACFYVTRFAARTARSIGPGRWSRTGASRAVGWFSAKCSISERSTTASGRRGAG